MNHYVPEHMGYWARHVWFKSYAYNRTVQPYAYSRTERVYANGLVRTEPCMYLDHLGLFETNIYQKTFIEYNKSIV